LLRYLQQAEEHQTGESKNIQEIGENNKLNSTKQSSRNIFVKQASVFG